jgi:hypothetical protein
MARQEPLWLTAIYTAVGFLIIAAVLGFGALVIAYWPFFLMLTVGGVGYWWFTKSPAAIERQAQENARALLDRVSSIDESQLPTVEDFTGVIVAALISGPDDALRPPKEVLSRMMDAADDLFAAEQFTKSGLPAPPARFDSIEGARYREHLQKECRKLSDPMVFATCRETTFSSFSHFAEALPISVLQPRRAVLDEIDGHTRAASLSIPLSHTLPDLRERVEELILPFYSEEARSLGLFSGLREQLDRNLHAASGIPYSPEHFNSEKLVMPSDYEGSDVVSTYLQHTPLEQIFSATVPFDLPEQARFEHTHILAGSGHGKTQTLQHLILSDLDSPNPPGLVVIDSQGDMLRKLSRLSVFDPDEGALASRLIIINPTDIEYPPALNMFDVNLERLGSYNAAAREQILNGVIELYDYIFGSLLGAELTQKQAVIFRYLTRLMLTIPGATIHTLIELMGDITPYAENIRALPPGARMFFETEFPHKSFTDTKRQIQRRLWGILENPTFERMLTAPRNRIDMFDALNTGKIVLVNTAKDFLKAERSSFLGRLFIALTLQAALERAALPERQRHPAFLYIDEAADYFDDNIDDLLTQARKYKLGVVFSHQYLGQLAPGLHSSIASNTSIKLAGGISDRDARSIAPDMRTTPTFILDQRKSAHATQFAAYVRNVTPTALSLRIPFGELERRPTMDANAYRALEAQNRARVSVRLQEQAAAEPRASPDPVHTPPHVHARSLDDGDDWSS